MKFEVLVIDDTYEIGVALEGILDHLGYICRFFENHQAGLKYFKTELNPIVFLDVNLPGKNGLELLQEIKDMNPDTQVIMMTGERDIQNVITSLENKASDFLLKPFTVSTVKTAITRTRNYYQLIKEKGIYQEAIERDLKFTAVLQKKIISPPINHKNIYADFYPVAHVSSDFYEILHLKNEQELIFFGDIEGTGVASGFVALLVLSIFKDISRNNHNPAEILRNINRELNTKLNTHTLAAVCIFIDKENRKLSYSIGGIPPPVLFKNTFEKSFLLTHSSNQIIGVLPDLIFELEEIEIEENDILYIYSDGFFNSISSDLRVKHNELIGQIMKSHTEAPEDFEKIKKIINQFVVKGKEEGAFKDDLSFFLYQF
ncbi:MAG: response regulator [Leptospiraceae bacterium]|nr:response regulator [Leptospiraceae bacterium]MCP5495036.1 response regulator [Leptospiraceae bacterium]